MRVFTAIGMKNTKQIDFSFFISFSFHAFMEGGPSVITDLQGALRLHYTYITNKRKIITKMEPNYNV